MRRIFVSILSAGALIAPCSHADEFSWQLTGGAQRTELRATTDADVATLAATYYFRPVDEEDRAYALAPFLGRASHIGASYHEDKTASQVLVATGPITSPTLPTSATATTVVTRAAGRGVSGRHVWRSSGWYAGGAFAEADAAQPAPVSMSMSYSVLGDEQTTRLVTFGKYVGPSTSVELSLETASTTLTNETFLSCSIFFCTVGPPVQITTVSDTEVDTVGVAAMHVGRLGRFDYALTGGIARSELDWTIEATQTLPIVQAPRTITVPAQLVGGVASSSPLPSPADSERYSLAAELFPTRALGIRVSYSALDGDDVSVDASYDLAATWFFRRNIGARVVLSRTEWALVSRNVDAVGLHLIGRL